MRIASITIDCTDPHRLAGFWSGLMNLSVTDIGGDYAELAPILPDGPTLLFLQVPEEKRTKNRVHLDVAVTDVRYTVDQALTMGATQAEGDLAGPFDWVVLLDPEGNEFCVCPSG